MAMDMDQVQRRDIDTALERITLGIDEENITQSPYQYLVTSFVGNNWVMDEIGGFVKYSLAEEDSISFPVDAITSLAYKDITNVTVSFDYEVSTKCVLRNVGFSFAEQTQYKVVETVLNGQGHIDVECSLFGFESDLLNTAISEQGFSIVLNFDGVKSNALVVLRNVTFDLSFSNDLMSESDAVVNRVNFQTDFYLDDDEIILQIGDGSGKGRRSDDPTPTGDTYTKAEIDSKLALKVDTITGKGLSTNDFTTTEKSKLSGVENNANYYVHPSSHSTNIITESSALNRLETSANATQHEINLAINDKIGSGGGGSVIGTGSFSINNNGHLIVELPNGVDNPYFINANGHLIYDTSNTHNGSQIFMTQYDLGKVTGDDGAKGDDGVGIASITKTGSSGLVDTYTITYTDGDTDTFTVTNGSDASVTIQTSFGSPTSDSKVPSEKLTKTELDKKISTSSTSGLMKNDGTVMSSGTGSSNWAVGNHTHSAYVNPTKVTSWSSTPSDNNVASEKLIKDSLDDKVSKSSTTGLLKNDGSVMTSGTGSSNWAVGNHSHSGYVSATKVTSWSSTVSDSNVPSEKLVKDYIDNQIGLAIQYIQQ